MVRLNQSKFFNKAIEIIRSCNSADHLEAARRVVDQYNFLGDGFSERDDNYDHEYNMYLLMAELKTLENKLQPMTSEAQIEEILMEADAYGVRQEVINIASKLMEEGHARVESFEIAFNNLTNEK